MSALGRLAAVLAILMAVIYAVGVAHELCTPSANLVRQKTNEYVYGHYSAITGRTRLWNPQYWLAAAASRTVTMVAGDALWIPAGWWHWVHSEPATVAVNMWTTDMKRDLPDFLHRPQHLRQTRFFGGVLPLVQSYKGSVAAWDTAHNTVLEPMPFVEFMRRREDDRFIITLEARSVDPTQKFNKDLYAHVAPAIIPPAFWAGVSTGTVNSNLWISSGRHDSGLHYDNSHGLLVVLQGRKRVQLFPPSQSALLRPLSVLPRWAAATTPIRMEYNTFAACWERCRAGTLPSARLLYETLTPGGSESFAQLLSLLQAQMGENNIVYGVKQVLGGGQTAAPPPPMRWELYAYHYSQHDRSQPPVSGMAAMLLPAPLGGDVVVHSKDFLMEGSNIVLGGDTHTYHALTALQFPHAGRGRVLRRSGAVEDESLFVITTLADMRANAAQYLSALQYTLPVAVFLRLLAKYACKDVALFNKYDGNIFVMYFGISLADYTAFLRAYEYPPKLVAHVAANKRAYEDIVHEVAIVYALDTLAPVRTAFYGLL
jgi:hypothetical protein